MRMAAKGVFSGLCSVGQLWQHPENTLDGRLAPSLDCPAAKRTTELQAIHALVPPFVLTTLWLEAACWNALALEIASLLQKRVILALLGSVKLTVS